MSALPPTADMDFAVLSPLAALLAQAVLFRGADITLVWGPLAAMLVIGSVYFLFAMSRFRRVIFGS